MTNPVIQKLRQGAALSARDEALVLEALNVTVSEAAGVDLREEGDSSDGLLFMLEGFACRYKVVEGGGRQIVSLLLPGDFCDVHASIPHEMDHSIATLSRCKLAVVQRPTVTTWLTNAPTVRRAFEWATLVDEAILREWLVNLGARGAFSRIAHLFCELRVRLQAVGIGDALGFPLPMTQEELSHMLGLSVVHVNRVLGRLRTDGLATFRGGHVLVPDGERLIAAAGFRPNYLHLPPREAAAA